MMSSVPLDRHGFTLLEVVAAIMVFAFGVLALSRTQIGAISTNSFANEVTEATKIAQERMETLTSLPYGHADLQDANGDGTGQDGNANGIDDDDEKDATDGIPAFGLNNTDQTGQTADFTMTQGRYTIFWNVAIDQPVHDTKSIRVIVRWQDKRGESHAVAVDSAKGLNY